MPGDFRCDRCEYSCASCTTTSHTRLRVHWAPGIPHALLGAEGSFKASGAIRAARVRRMSQGRHCERSEAIHPSTIRKNGLLRCARNDVETASCAERKNPAARTAEFLS